MDKVEIEKAKTTERWWSVQARNHTVLIDIGGKGKSVKFKNFALILDVSDPSGKEVSTGLRAHPQCGISFYLVEPSSNTDDGKKRRLALMRMIRKIITEATTDGRVRVVALEQIRALFSHAQLANANLDVVTSDADALLDLAVRTVSLKGLE